MLAFKSTQKRGGASTRYLAWNFAFRSTQVGVLLANLLENRSIGFQSKQQDNQKANTEIGFQPQSKKQEAKCQKQM